MWILNIILNHMNSFVYFSAVTLLIYTVGYMLYMMFILCICFCHSVHASRKQSTKKLNIKFNIFVIKILGVRNFLPGPLRRWDWVGQKRCPERHQQWPSPPHNGSCPADSDRSPPELGDHISEVLIRRQIRHAEIIGKVK